MMESTLKKQRLGMNLQQTNSSNQNVEPSVTPDFRVNSRGHVRPTRYKQPHGRETIPASSNAQSGAITPALSEFNMADHTEGGSSSLVETLQQPDYQCTDESATAIIHPSIPLATEVSELMNTTNWQATLDQDVHISDKWDDMLGEPDACDASPLDDDEESETESRSGSAYIYRGHWMTVEISLLLILTFAMTHSITDVQLSDILALISLHCMDTHPALGSLYKFKKYFEKADSPVQKFYYCGSCFSSVEDGQTNCYICRTTIDFEKNKFLNVPLEPQIQNFFQRPGFVDDIQHRFKRSKKKGTNIEDIYDGAIYTSFSQTGGPLSSSYPHNISFCLNTDGIPVFKSSKVSIWPVYLMINELEYKLRKQKENMLFCGLWCGESKPLFSVFSRPFLHSLKNLEEQGVTVQVNEKKEICKGFVLCSTADLPAKSALMNMVQYNGKYGCPNCLQPGQNFRTQSGGNIHVFPFDKNNPAGTLRSSEQSFNDAKEALAQKVPVNGIKGPSFLMGLRSYNFILSTSIDYMHCVLLGITKCLLSLWFSSSNSREHFSLLPHLDLIDGWLLKIKPPYLVTRVPRAIGSHFKFWKASELRSWLLFYSLPLLFELMDSIQFCHYAAFVESIHILTKDSIVPGDIERSNTLLKYFVFMMPSIYGDKFCTLNVHSLLHLSECVRNLGPLWAHSCFPFENINGKLLKLFHGTQNVDLQIVNSVSILQQLPNLTDITTFPDECKSFMDKLLKKNKGKVGSFIGVVANVVGPAHHHLVPGSLLNQIQKVTKLHPNFLFSFQRILIRNQIYHSKSYKRVSSRNSYSVKFITNSCIEYGFIDYFIYVLDHPCECDNALCNCTKEGVAIVEKMQSLPDFFQTKIDVPSFLPLEFSNCHALKSTGITEVINIEQIISLCCCVETENVLFFSDFPNFKETD